MKTGIGFDAHRFIENRPLILGGVKIEHPQGLAGHSDADVLLHAIIDALLGAASLGNIGLFFPDKDPTYKDISSLTLLEKTGALLEENHYKIVNVDSVVILEEPRLGSYLETMIETIAKTLHLTNEQVSIKPKTTELMGFTGRKEGIAALATVLLTNG